MTRYTPGDYHVRLTWRHCGIEWSDVWDAVSMADARTVVDECVKCARYLHPRDALRLTTDEVAAWRRSKRGSV